MLSLNRLKKIRTPILALKRLYFTKLWRMDIDPSASFSLSAKFDTTYPKGIHIGAESYIAFGAVIMTHDMTRGLYLDTRIGRRCFIGARSMILPGVTIGDESIVAAGSIVTKDVPPRSMVAGNPAKIIRENIEVERFGRLKGADDNEHRCLRLAVAIIAFIITSMPLAGCDALIAVPGKASVDAPLDAKSNAPYLLNTGDVIKLTVYGEDVLTGQYTVNQNGFVTIPLINTVQASGLSKEDLQQNIATALRKGGYLTKPLVTVDIITVRPFYILGEVKNPGSYPWQPSFNVFKAIATAGGYTPRAAKGKILIDRGDGAEKQHLNATEDTPVLPGDSITVRERIF